MRWRARTYDYVFPGKTLVMGVVNVTPDSFSDGGKYLEPSAAVAHGIELAGEGADILDIGGESTRPGAPAVPEEEEVRRVIPVIEALRRRVGIPISVDTRKPEVARAAITAGASIVNDIGGRSDDREMWGLVRDTGVGYVCMHMQGEPATMQDNPSYEDVVAEVREWFVKRLGAMVRAGLSEKQVVLDVGIGFGKRLEHNLKLLRAIDYFNVSNRPIMVGVSRKSFIGKVLGADTPDRLPGSLACACWAVSKGVAMIRTHDVAATVHAVRMTEHLLGRNTDGGVGSS